VAPVVATVLGGPVLALAAATLTLVSPVRQALESAHASVWIRERGG
jgi:hypothetical protein